MCVVCLCVVYLSVRRRRRCGLHCRRSARCRPRCGRHRRRRRHRTIGNCRRRSGHYHHSGRRGPRRSCCRYVLVAVLVIYFIADERIFRRLCLHCPGRCGRIYCVIFTDHLPLLKEFV